MRQRDSVQLSAKANGTGPRGFKKDPYMTARSIFQPIAGHEIMRQNNKKPKQAIGTHHCPVLTTSWRTLAEDFFSWTTNEMAGLQRCPSKPCGMTRLLKESALCELKLGCAPAWEVYTAPSGVWLARWPQLVARQRRTPSSVGFRLWSVHLCP